MPEDKMPAPQLHIIDGHEGRLQHVEQTQHELAVKVAENTQQIQFVATEVQAGFGRMSEKIEQCIKPLTDAMGPIVKSVGEHGQYLDKIRDRDKASAERWDWWKKALATIITGAGAIGLKELVAFIVHHAR